MRMYRNILDPVITTRVAVILAKFGVMTILFNKLTATDFVIYAQITSLSYFVAILLGCEFSLVTGKLIARSNYTNTESFKSHMLKLKFSSFVISISVFMLIFLFIDWSNFQKFLSIIIIASNFYWIERYKISIYNNARNWVAACVFVRELSWCLPIILVYLTSMQLSLSIVLICWSGVMFALALADWLFVIRAARGVSEIQAMEINSLFLLVAVFSQVLFKVPTTFDRFLFEKYMDSSSLASYSFSMSILLTGAAIFDAAYFSKITRRLMRGVDSGLTKSGVILVMSATLVFTYLWGGSVYYFSAEYLSAIFDKNLSFTYFWLAFVIFSYSIIVWVLSSILLGFDLNYLSLVQKYFFLIFFIFWIFILWWDIKIIPWQAIISSLWFYLINSLLVFWLVQNRSRFVYR